MPCGYHGRILRVDLSSRSYELQELPERLLRDFIGGAARGVGLSKAELDLMVAGYYRARGWTSEGLIPETKLRELGLREVVGSPGEDRRCGVEPVMSAPASR